MHSQAQATYHHGMSGFQKWTEVNGVRVEPGATWSSPTEPLRFQISIRCVSTSPDRFVGLVTWRSTELAKTSEVKSIDQATEAANALIADALSRLFN